MPNAIIHDAAPPPPLQVNSVPLSLLGNVNTSTFRRLVHIHDKHIAANAKGELTNFDPFSTTAFGHLTQYWPTVLVTDLVITLMPGMATTTCMTALTWCWYPDGETAPTSEQQVLAFPTGNKQHQFAAIPGGIHPSLVIACPLGQYQLQRNVKPKPAFGGTPRLHVTATSFPFPTKELDTAGVLYSVKIEMIVQIGL